MKNKDFRTVRGYELHEKNKRLLTSAMEDYLEMIYRETIDTAYVRISTLAKNLNVNPSSSTKMVQRLAILNMVTYEKYGLIQLTKKGEELGEYLFKRHQTVEKFLCFLTNKLDCLHDTEIIEHNVGADLLNNLNMFNEFLEENEEVVDRFYHFVEWKL